MDFTLKQYQELLTKLKKEGYKAAGYDLDINTSRQLILRHDIDIDVWGGGAKGLAEVEERLGFYSMWFIQPNNDCYNMLSRDVLAVLRELARHHKLGLHIDPMLFCGDGSKDLAKEVESVYTFYSQYIPLERVFSFHRPGVYLSDMSIEIPGFINACDKRIMKNFAYISDSNRRPFMDLQQIWDIIKNGSSLQLLTHPLWWGMEDRGLDRIYSDLKKTVERHCCQRALAGNIKCFTEFLRGEV